MERERIKQRLVGAIVLVALGVIFIPMILDGGGDESMPPFGSNIPEKPRDLTKLKKMELPPAPTEPEPVPPSAMPVDEDTPAAQDSSEPAAAPTTHDAQTSTSSTPATEDTARTDSDAVEAWVVQVGSFANRNNALRLQERLRDKQFKAFVEEVKTDKGLVYRVRVGPEIKRATAEQQQKQIAKAFDLNAVVMRHR